MPALVLLLTGLLGCKNECVDLCQHYEMWLDDCGFGWTTAFPEEGWESIEDCYDAHWEASGDELGQCAQESRETLARSCY